MMKTKLGFGCAPMLGRVGKQESLQALEIAFSEGINYFDIARSYGWGEAESLLGDFLIDHKIPRHQLEITTKFGLVPRNNKWIRASKNVARKFINIMPKTQKLIRDAASTVAAPQIDFTVENAKISLETSLKSLRTDYIDSFLLHDYDFQNISDNLGNILEFIDTNKKYGIIRKYGFSASQPLELIHTFLKENNLQPDILQIPCSIVKNQTLEIIQQFNEDGISLVLHSPFRLEPDASLIFSHLETQNLLVLLESNTGLKIESLQDFYKIILSYFRVVYSPYAIVTSMFDTCHIRLNNNIIQNPVITKEQAEKLRHFLIEEIAVSL